MSAVTVPVQGRIRSYGKKIADTLANTCFTAKDKTQSVVLAVSLANIDGTSAVDATVAWFDTSASATFYIAWTKSVAADGREQIEFPVALDPGDEIRVTAGAANDLDVIVTVAETAVSS